MTQSENRGVVVPSIQEFDALRSRVEAIEAKIDGLPPVEPEEPEEPPIDPEEPPVDPPPVDPKPEEPVEPPVEPPPPGEDHSHHIGGHHAVPDFAAHPTHEVTEDCLWSEIQGITEDSRVKIKHGVTVRVDWGRYVVKAIGVHGTLRFDHGADISMKVQEILVYSDGYLEIGTEETPVINNIEIVFADKPLVADLGQGIKDPSQWGNGLIVFGKIRVHGRPLEQTFVRLPSNPMKGDALPSLPGDWQAGDLVVVPSTKQIPRTSIGPQFLSQSEEFKVGDGKKFIYDHAGPFTPHVANMTRNVVIRSENPDVVMRRGHCVAIGRADVDIRYAEFHRVGRTTPMIRPTIDATTFNADGTVLKHAQNHIGRYGFHFHHVNGPENPTNTGYQGRIQGCAFTGWHLWALSIHSSDYMLVEGNTFYAGEGSGVGTYYDASASAIVTETGNENFNRIEGNFVCHSKAGSKQQIFGAHGFSIGGIYKNIPDTARNGIWMAATNNEVVNNVLTCCPDWGIIYNGHDRTGNKLVSLFRGADKHDPSQTYMIKDAAILLDSGNEVYGEMGDGLWLAYRGNSSERSVIDNFRAWHTTRAGVYDWGQTTKMTYSNIELVGDPTVIDHKNFINAGMSFGDTYYHNEGLVVENASIRGFGIGVKLPHRGNKKLIEFNNIKLDNYINLECNPCRFDNDLRIAVEGAEFRPLSAPIAGHPQPCNVWMNLIQNEPHTFILGKVTLVVNGQRIYFREQADDFVIPAHRVKRGGTLSTLPAVGKTNAEAMAELGVAIGGEVAPESAVDGAPEIIGLVEAN